MTRIEPERKSPFESTPDRSPIASGEGSRHNVSSCPICGGGLCGVRVYFDSPQSLAHGLVVCDECEAIWLQPDTQGVHVYANAELPVSPIGGQGLYDTAVSRWANADDLKTLGWSSAIDASLTYDPASTESANDLPGSEDDG